MNLRTSARVLVAVAFSISGLVETLSATGLVMELSPDGHWGPGFHTLAVSGPLQLAGAALIAFGRTTRLALSVLGCYAFLASIFGNLPLIFNPDVGGRALAGLLSNLVGIGGILILYWLHGGWALSAPDNKTCTSSDKSCTRFAGQATRLPSLQANRTCARSSDPSIC